ncbi:Cif family virulence factor [Albibacillus kandeliae]|uniref:nuclear transport factor 2 family protein n=1 Tax=Albibacillus kandeliae TaxID=2174228 RepID=UPI000D69DE32|nr:nuclear transport factor 2 family protein [Albibacillus kandeliae]
MADKDIAGVRAAIDRWIDGWTFSPENPWSLDKFEAILDPDCMVIDDYGGELSLLYGHKDYAGIWGPMVAKYMKIWKILPEEDSIQIWTEGSIACASFILRGGGELADGTQAKLRQWCTFPMEKRGDRWIILKEHITTDPEYST